MLFYFDFWNFFFNIILNWKLSAEVLCVSPAPGGECFHVSVEFMLGEAGKRSMSKGASKPACDSVACSSPLCCFCPSDSIVLAVRWPSLFFILRPDPVLCGGQHFATCEAAASRLLCSPLRRTHGSLLAHTRCAAVVG